MLKYLFFVLLTPTGISSNQSWISYMVFWNVGQGQWATAITPDQCQHFDFGGELKFWGKNKNLFLKLCKEKTNVLYLSHPDLDHYSLYSALVRSVPKICWGEIDHTKLPSHRLTQKIPYCGETIPAYLRQKTERIYNPVIFNNKNDSSKIYKHQTVLIPGDSSQKHEKIWAKSMIHHHEIKILLLGHHGSRTSTSSLLLRKLSNLKMAFVQSRKNKFGHPHPETTAKLKKLRIPLIKSEDWGNIVILI